MEHTHKIDLRKNNGGNRSNAGAKKKPEMDCAVVVFFSVKKSLIEKNDGLQNCKIFAKKTFLENISIKD